MSRGVFVKSIITAKTPDPESKEDYSYIGMSIDGSQYVLFSERCSGVVLCGDNHGKYYSTFIESLYHPMGTLLTFAAENYLNDVYPCVVKGDDGMSAFFKPYRLYFSDKKYMGFEIFDDGSVLFSHAVETNYTNIKDYCLEGINLDLDFL